MIYTWHALESSSRSWIERMSWWIWRLWFSCTLAFQSQLHCKKDFTKQKSFCKESNTKFNCCHYDCPIAYISSTWPIFLGYQTYITFQDTQWWSAMLLTQSRACQWHFPVQAVSILAQRLSSIPFFGNLQKDLSHCLLSCYWLDQFSLQWQFRHAFTSALTQSNFFWWIELNHQCGIQRDKSRHKRISTQTHSQSFAYIPSC